MLKPYSSLLIYVETHIFPLLTKEIAIPITFNFSDNSMVGHYMTEHTPLF